MMLADFILHVDRHLREFVDAYGLWVYALLFLVIFVETGLVVMPFLPGDSLLFVVGALAGAGLMSYPLVMALLLIAAVAGNQTNYAIGRALADLGPATVAYSHARASFAMNRRKDYTLPAGDPRAKAPNPRGPVDHDVPVLKVERPGGKLHAIAFGYACHNTTLAGLQLNGDYAGFAQITLEAAHPGVTTLFVQGCGADQNPHPRRTMVPGKEPLDLAKLHGQSLALAVEAALNVVPTMVSGPLRAAYEKVDLDFTLPTRDELQRRTTAGTAAEKARARELLAHRD